MINDKFKGVVIAAEVWQGSDEGAKQMLKLTVLNCETYENETFHIQLERAKTMIGDMTADKETVIEFETEMQKAKVGNTYSRRLVSMKVTGEKFLVEIE